MKLKAARKIVEDRLAFLEREYASCKDPYNKRLMLMNMDSCHEMLMYLKLLSEGKRVKFTVRPEVDELTANKIVQA